MRNHVSIRATFFKRTYVFHLVQKRSPLEEGCSLIRVRRTTSIHLSVAVTNLLGSHFAYSLWATIYPHAGSSSPVNGASFLWWITWLNEPTTDRRLSFPPFVLLQLKKSPSHIGSRMMLLSRSTSMRGVQELTSRATQFHLKTNGTNRCPTIFWSQRMVQGLLYATNSYVNEASITNKPTCRIPSRFSTFHVPPNSAKQLCTLLGEWRWVHVLNYHGFGVFLRRRGCQSPLSNIRVFSRIN